MDKEYKRAVKGISTTGVTGTTTNTNAHLKVNSRGVKKKSAHMKNRSIQTKALPNIDGIPIKKEPLDIRLSCEYIFQYLFENKCINQKYFNMYTLLMYVTLVLVNSSILAFLLFTREPNLAHKYECFNVKTFSYGKCTNRNWCSCTDTQNCVAICYDSRGECMQEFVNKMSNASSDSLYYSISEKVFIRFINALGGNVNIYEGALSNFCNLKAYTLLIAVVFFVGGTFGCLFFGILAERFGKKLIILSQTLLIITALTLISIFSNFKYPQYSDTSSFLAVWCVNGFFLGMSLLSAEYIVYLQYMEMYPNINSYGKINGYFHSHFAFSGLVIYLFNNIINNLTALFYVLDCYFLLFFILFLIFFAENPRFFSERKDFLNKQISFEKLITKAIAHKKKDNGEEEKFWKIVVFYDSSIQKVEGDEIKDKVIGVNEDELESLCQARHRGMLNGGGNINMRNQKKLVEGNSAKNKRSTKKSLKSEIMQMNLVKLREKDSNSEFPANTNLNINNIRKTHNKANISNSIANFNKEKMNEALSQNKKKEKQLSIKDIFNKYQEDRYLSRYFYIFFLCWLSISFCFYGMCLSLILDVSNPNFVQIDVGAVVYTSIMCFSIPIIFGNLTFYFSSDKIIIISMLTYAIISTTLDSYRISPDAGRGVYFGDSTDYSVSSTLHYNRATGTYFMFVSYSLIEKMTIVSAPTLYRTYFLSVCKGFAKLTSLIAYLSITRLDTPFLNVSIISLFTCLIFFWVDIQWKEIKLYEYIDSENLDNKMKKEKKKMKIEVNLEGRKSRTSVFSRLRSYSYQKLRKAQ